MQLSEMQSIFAATYAKAITPSLNIFLEKVHLHRCLTFFLSLSDPSPSYPLSLSSLPFLPLCPLVSLYLTIYLDE